MLWSHAYAMLQAECERLIDAFSTQVPFVFQVKEETKIGAKKYSQQLICRG
jgi:hypothetical protein